VEVVHGPVGEETVRVGKGNDDGCSVPFSWRESSGMGGGGPAWRCRTEEQKGGGSSGTRARARVFRRPTSRGDGGGERAMRAGELGADRWAPQLQCQAAVKFLISKFKI
jgi:hypothetical protein